MTKMLALPDHTRPRHEVMLHRTIRKSRRVLAALVLGLGLPMAVIPISGAVIASGEVSVASHVKKIAHPRGGVIAEIPVSNGMRVKAGQLLMRLDTNVSAASAAMTVESIDQLRTREARLRAERDGSAEIAFPADLLARQSEPPVARALSEERRIFALDRQTLAGQRAAIQAQIAQAGKAAGNYRVQADVYRQQAALIAEERKANDALWEKRYTTLQRRNELARGGGPWRLGRLGRGAGLATGLQGSRTAPADLRDRGKRPRPGRGGTGPDPDQADRAQAKQRRCAGRE
jgi:HlyD family secretion protein